MAIFGRKNRNTPKEFAHLFYLRFLKPSSRNEDKARREYIFNTLLVGLLVVTATAFIVTLGKELFQGQDYEYSSPILFLIPILLLLMLYKFSRKNFSNWIVFFFIAIYLLLGTYALYAYGYILPAGLLTYVVVIIISGILISSVASFIMTVVVMASVAILALLQSTGVILPNVEDMDEPMKASDVIVLLVMFAVIYLVSWLYNREIAKSLIRARKSEKLLRRERNLLEIKVRQRTEQLEKAQVEKNMELYRFAEFGRLSSSLLHDIANPLTAVSLNLDMIGSDKKSDLMVQVKEGIQYMEQYVQTARRQLRNEKELKIFDSQVEIKRVASLLASKALENKVTIKLNLEKNARLYGDNSRFSQVIANLLANSIDSYGPPQSEGRKNRNDRKASRIVEINTVTSPAEKNIYITVRDRGVGISKKELTRIFDPFYTTKSSDRGTGIGLTITKKIVEEEFVGQISAESGKDKGAEFHLVLPLHSETEMML